MVTSISSSRFISNPLNCPVTRTMGIIGGKWKPIILNCIGDRTIRFGKLKQIIPSISNKVLANELKELETFGSCNKLILVYGSATANAVWMKPGSKVLLLTDFSRYTTQVEKAFFDACKVVWKEIDTSSYSRLDDKLLEEISNFINH